MNEVNDSAMENEDNRSSTTEPELKGVDLARRALEDARAAAKASGKSVGQGRKSPTGGVRALRGRRRRGWSGPGPDDRDPQTLGSLTGAIAKTRGWSDKVSEGTVLGRWPLVVGEDIAAHAVPTKLEDGVLSVTAESTPHAVADTGQDRCRRRPRRCEVFEDSWTHNQELA
jgi:predicted nucleic acid-binding Zn ribbon protein